MSVVLFMGQPRRSCWQPWQFPQYPDVPDNPDNPDSIELPAD